MSFLKNYRSIEEFEREEIRPSFRIGFFLDDLVQESMIDARDMLFDELSDDFDE